ncbi:MAG: hypothetical protein Fues2KO_31500 [Fuerstiella sp.]
MRPIQTLWLVCLFCLPVWLPSAIADEPTAPVAPVLRQPGDDEVKVLESEPDPSEEQKAESLAAYMEAIAAQKEGRLNEALQAFERAEKADPKAAEPVKAHALLLMRLGRVAQAQQKAQRAIELDPDDFETRIQLAILLLADRTDPTNPGKAAQLIEEALQSKTLQDDSKEFVSIHAVRGRLYLQAQDAGKAAESYRVILDALERPEDFGLDFREHQKLVTDRATGYEAVGRVMLQVGRNNDAIRAFEAWVRLNEDRPGEHHYWLALAQYRKDQLEQSEKNLNLYFDSDARSAESLRLLNDLYQATSRSDQVIERLRELAKDSTEAAQIDLFIGGLLIEKGEADQAAEMFRKVIEGTGDAEGYLGLIQVAVAKRDPAELLDNLQKALRARIQIQELFPIRQLILNDPVFGKEVVKAAVERSKDEAAQQHPLATFFVAQLADDDNLELPAEEEALLRAVLDQNAGPRLGLQVLNLLGMNLYNQDKFAEAAETFQKLLEFPGLPEPERLNTLFRLAVVEVSRENYDGALTAIDAALAIQPRVPQLLYQRGMILLQADRYEMAEETLRQTVELPNLDPELAGQVRILLGGLYTRTREWPKAIEVYQQLLSEPELADDVARRARSGLSNAYVQSGDEDKGEQVLEEIYAETPDDPGINNDLGYLYADRNRNLDKAEKMIRIAVEAEPENAAYLDSLGWVLYRQGRFQEALEQLKKANSDPEYRDPTIMEHLGDVYKALDQAAEARKMWQQALDREQEAGNPDPKVVERLKDKLKPAEADPSEEQS